MSFKLVPKTLYFLKHWQRYAKLYIRTLQYDYTFFKDLFNTRQHHRETASTTFLGAEFDASSHLFDDEHTDGQA